jgi:hypothetical protein
VGIGMFKIYLTHRGGIICRLLRYCFILAIGIAFFMSYDLPRRNRFGECILSNWRVASNTKLDFSTNVCAYHQYSGVWAKYMRVSEFKDFQQRISRGDTLNVGIDYYALTGASRMFFSKSWILENTDKLIDGEVIVAQIHK